MNKLIASFEIHDTFRITGRGIVFAGIILEGEIRIGDIIKFNFNGQVLERKINGIHAGMRSTEGRPNVGVLIESPNTKEIDDLRNWNPNQTIGNIYKNIE